MAAALLARQCADHGIAVDVRSAGTDVSSTAQDRAVATVMRERGLEPGAVSRQITGALVAADGADLVIGLAREHVRHASLLGADVLMRAFTFKELARRVESLPPPPIDHSGIAAWRHALGSNRLARDLLGNSSLDDVEDPSGRSLARHRRTADELEELSLIVVRSLVAWM